jgi:ribonuclease P protein component
LRRRPEFLRASASGLSRQASAFKLQMAVRKDDAAGAPRFGVTVTKKVAGAVGRNRIRRRLKEALRIGGALAAGPGCDYVIVARRAALTTPFSDLTTQLADGLARLSRVSATPRPANPRNRPLAP